MKQPDKSHMVDGADPISENKNRLESGKMADAKAMAGGGKIPKIGEKASGYRKVAEAKPAKKAKREM